MQAGASSYTHEKVSPAVSRSHSNRHGGKDGVRSTRCGVRGAEYEVRSTRCGVRGAESKSGF